jgi:hypothetical protein
MKTTLAHFVVAQALSRAAIEDFVEVSVSDHHEPHPEAVRIVESLPPRGPSVSLRLEKRFHLDHEPGLIASIMNANVVVFVLASHARSLVAEDFVEELGDELPFLFLTTIAKLSHK